VHSLCVCDALGLCTETQELRSWGSSSALAGAEAELASAGAVHRSATAERSSAQEIEDALGGLAAGLALELENAASRFDVEPTGKAERLQVLVSEP